jgi:peptide/nickel transport system substrate-binding protein
MWIFCIQKGEKLSNFKGSKSWRLILLLSVFALVVVACGGDTAEEVVEETTETTAAPATTAAQAEEIAPSGPDGVYKMAIFSEPATQNYFKWLDTDTDTYSAYQLTNQITTLFTVSTPNFVLVPNMATELVETNVDNGDGTYSYIVPIASGYEWSDGVEITANDWEWTWETVTGLPLLGQWQSAYPSDCSLNESTGEYRKCVVDIEATDDYTVKITFNYDPGLSGWQYGVAQSAALPEHYWSQFATSREDLLAVDGLDAPTQSAFLYDKVEQGAFTTWTYDADTMYFGGETTIYDGGTAIKWDNGVAPAVDAAFGDTSGDSFTFTNGPFVGTVEFSIYSDQDSAYLAFENGEVDFVLNPSGVKKALYEKLSRIQGVEVASNFSNGMRYMAFNTRLFPGSDKAFRQAVGCIVDKEFVINNVLQGVAINMDGQMPAALTAWVAPVTGVLADCDGLSAEDRWNKSIGILQDAGWTATDWGSHPGGNERAVAPTGVKGPNGESAPDNMLLYAPGPGFDPIRSTFSLFIADYMQQLGFDVVARPTGFGVIVDLVFTAETCRDWHFYMLGWGLTTFPDHPATFFDSAQDTCTVEGYNTPGYNTEGGYQNPAFEKLISDFKLAKTVGEAQRISKEMEAILFDDMPYLVLVTTPVLEVYRSSVEFPYTDTLDGIQDLGGLPTNVKVSQ